MAPLKDKSKCVSQRGTDLILIVRFEQSFQQFIYFRNLTFTTLQELILQMLGFARFLNNLFCFIPIRQRTLFVFRPIYRSRTCYHRCCDLYPRGRYWKGSNQQILPLLLAGPDLNRRPPPYQSGALTY